MAKASLPLSSHSEIGRPHQNEKSPKTNVTSFIVWPLVSLVKKYRIENIISSQPCHALCEVWHRTEDTLQFKSHLLLVGLCNKIWKVYELKTKGGLSSPRTNRFYDPLLVLLIYRHLHLPTAGSEAIPAQGTWSTRRHMSVTKILNESYGCKSNV